MYLREGIESGTVLITIRYPFSFQFNFQNVLPWKMHQTYMEQRKNKGASGNTGKKLLKQLHKRYAFF